MKTNTELNNALHGNPIRVCTTPPPLSARRPLICAASLGAFIAVFGAAQSRAANRWWDTGAGAGVGGNGTWGTTFSTTAGGTALTTAAATDDAIFEGTAGVITLGANQTANSLTFNTTGYKITGNSATARTISGPVTLGGGINLIVGNGETTDIRIGLGSVSGTAGATLTINGAATGSAVTRLDLSTGTTPTISVPILITGTGFANIAGGAVGTQVTGTVTGNGARLNLGATSGNTIAFTQKIDNGTGTVRIAGGSSGGAGVVTLSGSGNTWGTTELNNAASGILRMGAANVLPTATTLTFGATANNGDSIVELAGNDTTIGQLTNGAQSGGILRNTSASAAKLTISGSDTAAAAFTGSIQNGPGAGAFSLVRSGSGKTILSGANTFTGGTTLSGGTLVAGNDSALGSTGAQTVTFNGGKLASDNDARSLANNVTVNNVSGNQITGSNSMTVTGTASGTGTLEVALAAGKSVTVNPVAANSFATDTMLLTSGTLLLGSSNKLGNSMKLNFNGGTLGLNNFSEGAAGTDGLGSLTLSANSTLDFGTPGVGSNLIQFGGVGSHTVGTLLIANYDAGSDHLYFAGATGDFTAAYAQGEVSFNGDAGYRAISFSGYFDITPIHEPTTIFGALSLIGLIGYRERRRVRRIWKRGAQDSSR